MKQRSVEILQRMIEAPSHRIRLAVLLDDYHVSDKTLRVDIAQLQSFARTPNGEALITETAHHLQLCTTEALDQAQALLDELDLYSYKLSNDERLLLLCIELIRCERWVSMQELADLMFVTRNTIISDCKAAHSFLERSGIELVSKSKYGLRIHATSEQKQRTRIDIFATLLATQHTQRAFFIEYLSKRLGYVVAPSYFLARVRAYSKQAAVFLPIEAETQIVACLTVLYNEYRQHPSSTPYTPTEAPLDMLGVLLTTIVEDIEGRPADPSFIRRLENCILSRNLGPSLNRCDDFDMYCAITHFLFNVGKALSLDLQNDELLIKALFSHVRSVIGWQPDAFEMQFSQTSTPIMELVLQAAQEHFEILEAYMRRPMDATMRMSVVVHICAALYRKESSLRTCTVAVVYASSKATGLYIEAQVKSLFKIEVGALIAIEEAQTTDFAAKGISFVLSTIPLERTDIDVLLVNPVLTVEDINQIQTHAFTLSRVQPLSLLPQTSMLARLSDLYAQSNARKLAYLNDKIAALLEEIDQVERQTVFSSPLFAALDKHYIRVIPYELDWRSAIAMSAQQLLEEGAIAQSYLDKAISNVEEYGAYIIISQHIALAHANAQDGAYADGLALLVSRDGIVFEGGECVHLLFFFSQTGETDYINLFKDIIALGNDQQALTAAIESEDAHAVYQHLVEILADYAGTR